MKVVCGRAFDFAVMLAFAPGWAVGQLPAVKAEENYQSAYVRGLALQSRLEFDSAIVLYRQCLSGIGAGSSRTDSMKRRDVLKRITECTSGTELLQDPRKFVITNLGPGVNTTFEDYAPVLTVDERLLVFTSRRLTGNTSAQRSADGKYYEDIFFVRRAGDSWTVARNMGPPINTVYHDSDLALSADGRQLFLYTDRNEGDIFVSEFAGGRWSVPSPLPAPVNTPYHESSVSLSANGKSLYVASERPGGQGGSDIYVFEKDDLGRWSPAVNLGPAVNTAWDEESPFIDYDGEVLYFSSTGHNSMGGYDIFRSELKAGQWTPAENLGYPINTPGHESYFVSTYDGRRAYYSSVRPEGLGEEDIYVITLPEELSRTKETAPEVQAGERADTKASWVVYFATGSNKLSAEGERSLRACADQLKTSGALLEVCGYTDSSGQDTLNRDLSLSRARSVQSFLESSGILPVRIRTAGFGASHPAASNQEEKNGRALNRRAEIRVIQE